MSEQAQSGFPTIKGFDRNGEPELRAGENGALEIVFNFMPPQTAAGEERSPDLFENFEKTLSTHLAVNVLRDDREIFLIPKPSPDTAARAAAYLSSFWKDHAKPLEAEIAAKPKPANAPFTNLKEFHAALVEQLAAPLLKHGFKKAGKSRYRDSHSVYFRRKSSIGMQTLSIYGGHLPPYLNPRATLTVTHDLVERIYGPMSGFDEAACAEMETIGRVLLIDDPSHTTRVYRPSHLKAWIEQLIPVFETQGLAQFAQLSDPANVERVYNDMSVEPPPYLKDFSDRIAVRGLILAKLLARPDIETIAAFHGKHLGTLEFKTTFPAVEAYVRATSREDMIARVR